MPAFENKRLNPAAADPDTPADFAAYEPDAAWKSHEQMGHSQAGGSSWIHYIHCSNPKIAVPPIDVDIEKMMTRLWERNEKAPDRNPRTFSGPPIGLPRERAPNPNKPPAVYAMQVNPNAIPGGKPEQIKHLQGIASDWADLKTIRRVSGFSFRGDTRSPNALRIASGFQPNSTRTDDAYLDGKVVKGFVNYVKRRFGREINVDEMRTVIKTYRGGAITEDLLLYMTWREIMKTEEKHLGRHIAGELLKGTISTTKSTVVAKGYASGDAKSINFHHGVRDTPAGFVYVVYLEGGFELPLKPVGHQWTQLFNEQEVAWIGSVPWANICGWRMVRDRYFKGPIYLRTSTVISEGPAMQVVYNLLSGKPQSNAMS